MVSPSEQEAVAQTVRVCRIIIGALVAGVLLFLATSFFLLQPAVGIAPGALRNRFLSYYVVPPAVGVNLLLAAFVPRFVAARVRRLLIRVLDVEAAKSGADLELLLNSYRTQLIISAALCEWAAFFATICYAIERSDIAILVASVALAGVAIHFPTQPSVEQWVDLQRELIERERHGGF